MKRSLVVLGSIVVLAGCGSGNSSDYATAEAVATAAGCGQIKPAPNGETTLFATDEVSCKHAGHYVQVDWFKDSDSLGNFKAASKGSGYVILYGPDWAISCVDDKNDCSAFKDRLGGSLG